MSDLLKQLREFHSISEWRRLMLIVLKVELASEIPDGHTLRDVAIQEHSTIATLYHSEFDCWPKAEWSVTLVDFGDEQ